MNSYVEIPSETLNRLTFPNLCPFTLAENTEAKWEIVGHTKSSGVSIPGVPFIVTSGRKCRFHIPVSSKFERNQHKLGLLSAILVFLPLFLFMLLAISNTIFDLGDTFVKVISFLQVIGVFGILLYTVKRWFCRHVWIDYVGTESLEVVFKRKQYVEKFCEENQLEYKRKLFNFRPD